MTAKQETAIVACLETVFFLFEVLMTTANFIATIVTVYALYTGSFEHWYQWVLSVIYLVILACYVYHVIKERTEKTLEWATEGSDHPAWQKHCNARECPLVKHIEEQHE
jgi:membrane protein implicated in regulation of membrane protease activity